MRLCILLGAMLISGTINTHYTPPDSFTQVYVVCIAVGGIMDIVDFVRGKK